jgi:hypothetical protein
MALAALSPLFAWGLDSWLSHSTWPTTHINTDSLGFTLKLIFSSLLFLRDWLAGANRT